MERDKIEFPYCTNCGAKVDSPKTNFCTNCGVKLNFKPSEAPLSLKDRIIKNKRAIVFSIAIIAVVTMGATISGILVYRYLEFSRKDSSEGNDDDEEIETVIIEDSWEIDSVKTATYVVDGDTYELNSSERVRLADIDAPENTEPGYEASRNYLISLILNKRVYLDIDDKYRTDVYGRLVAVTYVRYNATHLLNVNQKMLDEGYAVIWNCDNQFNPYTWLLYVYYS